MFKKKKAPPKGMRKKRALDEDADGAAAAPDATTEALMVKGVYRPATAAAGSAEDDDASAVVRDGDGPFRKKAHTISSADPDQEVGAYAKASMGFAHQSEGADQHVYGGSATSYNEIDTAQDRDARALLEKAHKLQRDGETNDDTKLYKGQAGYKSYTERNEASIGGNKATGTQGPIRAPQFFRATCRFDYQPDICKDYKDTGFCGFGDSCKFMHDRGNFKTGWQMEQEWDEQQKKRKEMIAMGIDPDAEGGDDEANKYKVGADDELPFACFLCRGAFKEVR